MDLLRLSPLVLCAALACTTASDATTSTGDTGSGSTTSGPAATSGDDPTEQDTHDSHAESTGATTGAAGQTTLVETTGHATHDTHEPATTGTTDTTGTTGSTESTASTGSTGAGDPPPIDEYCACMLENCHDQYHEAWGEDHEAAEAMCAAAAGAVPSVGMPATEGDSLECRYHYCQLGHDDPGACESAMGGGVCV